MIGHEGHPEVEGTMGQSRCRHVPGRNASRTWRSCRCAIPQRLAYVTQTTLSMDDCAAHRRGAQGALPRDRRPEEGRHLLRHAEPPGRGEVHGAAVRRRDRRGLAQQLELQPPARSGAQPRARRLPGRQRRRAQARMARGQAARRRHRGRLGAGSAGAGGDPAPAGAGRAPRARARRHRRARHLPAAQGHRTPRRARGRGCRLAHRRVEAHLDPLHAHHRAAPAPRRLEARLREGAHRARAKRRGHGRLEHLDVVHASLARRCRRPCAACRSSRCPRGPAGTRGRRRAADRPGDRPPPQSK